ncbi:MAG: heparinase [Lachnospiraceae bacterium]|nr:heparinase [Lachnospiraceae bacterium]
MDIGWTLRRLKVMSKDEVLWRLSQKKLERDEKKAFGREKVSVTEAVYYSDVDGLTFHAGNLPLHEYATLFCENVAPRRTIDLPGSFGYETYRKRWHAGFQTENEWPLVFSYDLTYKQRDDIGDARTNWELNRHFQLALLAKAYYDTHDLRYLDELIELFDDWNAQNPYLWGISWTSPMEVAIRLINWMFALGFLIKSIIDPKKLDERLKTLFNEMAVGIINMTSYISAHYSRYSSANNHVIVEMAAIGMAGLCFEHDPWRDLAVTVLNYEIPRQNYHDGVNKEQSLHYQAFFMEAVGLLMMTLKKNKRNIPMNWKYVLTSMTGYLADCRGYMGETIIFGDDDGGKILDLFHNAGKTDYVGYVLHMMDGVLTKSKHHDRFTKNDEIDSNRSGLTESDHSAVSDEKAHSPEMKDPDAVCYPEGGVTLMHTHDHRAFLAIDHGPLGFGSIAAHGHADALSFQLYLDGEVVFADPGTYIYHTDRASRDLFRSTACHNTITIDGKNQSEMLGPFLWGKRAETTLLAFDSEKQVLEASHDGYAPVIHSRRFELGEKSLTIIDTLSDSTTVSDAQTGQEAGRKTGREFSWEMNYTLGENVTVQNVDVLHESDESGDQKETVLRTKGGNVITLQVEDNAATLIDGYLSPAYGEIRHTKQVRYEGTTAEDLTVVTRITWE